MTIEKPRTFRLNWITFSALCLLCVAACIRFTSLANLPGINADEADMGVRILQMLHGQPYSLRSHTGEFFNPMFIFCQVLLLRLFAPNFYLLRLPAAIFAAVGIAILIYAYAKIYSNWTLALMLGAVVGCFPLHLIFSRLAWDPTFLFFWTPILLLLSLRIIAAPRPGDLFLLGITLCLSIWTYGMVIVFVIPLLLALCWMMRDRLARWMAARMPRKLRPVITPNSGTILFAGSALLAGAAVYGGRLFLIGKIPQLAEMTPQRTLAILHSPHSLVLHLRLLGDMLSSYRGISYIAGIPDSQTFAIASWIVELFLFVCCIRLLRSDRNEDRFLALVLLLYYVLIVCLAGFLHSNIGGYERYLTPMMVLLPLIVVRGVPIPALLIPVCCLMLGEYWVCFEQPVLECRYVANTEFTFRTGLQEPKAEAAKLILRLSQSAPRPVVYTDLYWLQKPLQFLLFGHATVQNALPEDNQLSPGDFIAFYAGEPTTDAATAALAATSHSFTSHTINNQSGVPQVVIFQIVK